jgi:small subunit ribosomal protein S21
LKKVENVVYLSQPGGLMAEVRIEGRDDFERALRKFKLQCKREGIVKNFKERQYYTKPSQKRRKAKKKR